MKTIYSICRKMTQDNLAVTLHQLNDHLARNHISRHMRTKAAHFLAVDEHLTLYTTLGKLKHPIISMHGGPVGGTYQCENITLLELRESLVVTIRDLLALQTATIPADLTTTSLETFRRQLTVLSWQDTDKWNELLKKGDALRISDLLPGTTRRALLNNFYNSFK